MKSLESVKICESVKCRKSLKPVKPIKSGAVRQILKESNDQRKGRFDKSEIWLCER